MKHVVADIETDGLLDALTKVHSLVLRDMGTGGVLSCADQRGYPPIADGLKVLAAAERVYFHNGVEFDIPALRKVYPSFTIDESRVRDTLVMARHRWAHIKESDFGRWRSKRLPGELIGSHSLKAWGYRLGVLKGNYGETTDWSKWTPAMQTYCEQDTVVGLALVKALRNAKLSPEAIETEHELAWYLACQQRNGVPFDVAEATTLQAKLAAIRENLAGKLRDEFGWWYENGGEFTPKRPNKAVGYVAGAAVCKLKRIEFKPSSRDHIAKRLTKLYGWTPTEFTDGGKPKVDDDIIGALPYPCAPLLTEYLLVQKRLGQIAEGDEAWLRYAKVNPETGIEHIHGQINQTGAVTHRASHFKPNLGQVVKVTSPYGPECRGMFRVPPAVPRFARDPWIMLGSDASGLELRCLAHYMAKYDDGAYGRVVTEGRNEDGTDVHSVNRNALELEGKKGRDDAKTFIYAYLYGAGDQKLGSIVAPFASPEEQARIGAKLRAKFERNIPALGLLTEAVRQKSKKDGWLRLIDGRRVYIRHDHAALNSLLQGTGAVICKRWIVVMNRLYRREFGEQSWRGKWAALLWVHDETQKAVRKSIAERAAQLDVQAIESLTAHFHFRVPLTGEAKLGANWRETH